MKRTNLMVDEELLEKARTAAGEKTYSATVNTALEELVRRERFDRALTKFADRVANDEQFRPGYVEEEWPEAAEELSRRPANFDHIARVMQLKARRI